MARLPQGDRFRKPPTFEWPRGIIVPADGKDAVVARSEGEWVNRGAHAAFRASRSAIF